MKIFHSFANVSKFWLVFLLVAKNGMLLNSEVLFHRLEKDDMAKRKDRAGLDFNKLVLAMLLQTLFYHVIQNLLVVIPFLFYSFFFFLVWRWGVAGVAKRFSGLVWGTLCMQEVCGCMFYDAFDISLFECCFDLVL